MAQITDILTVATPVRFRAASGEATFYDPFNDCLADNSERTEDDGQGGTKGTWMTLDPGAQIGVVAGYGTTFFLVVNETGDGLKSENSYGLVVRDLSMKKILKSVVVGAVEVAKTAAA